MVLMNLEMQRELMRTRSDHISNSKPSKVVGKMWRGSQIMLLWFLFQNRFNYYGIIYLCIHQNIHFSLS